MGEQRGGRRVAEADGGGEHERGRDQGGLRCRATLLAARVTTKTRETKTRRRFRGTYTRRSQSELIRNTSLPSGVRCKLSFRRGAPRTFPGVVPRPREARNAGTTRP